MEVAPTPSREHHGTCQRFIDQIRIEMDVEDATSELIGKVIYIRLAGCFATGEFSEVAPVPSLKFGMDDRDVEQGPAPDLAECCHAVSSSSLTLSDGASGTGTTTRWLKTLLRLTRTPYDSARRSTIS